MALVIRSLLRYAVVFSLCVCVYTRRVFSYYPLYAFIVYNIGKSSLEEFFTRHFHYIPLCSVLHVEVYLSHRICIIIRLNKKRYLNELVVYKELCAVYGSL